MQNVMTPLVTMYQTQLEASRRFADAVFSGTEKIDRVIIDATHRVVTEQLNYAEAVASVRDPVTAGTALQSSFFSGHRNHAAEYQKEIMRIFAEMQNEIGRSWQDYLQQFRTQASNSATKPIEAAQTRTNDAMFDPMRSMFSVWESAFKDVADLARQNLGAANSAGIDAGIKVTQGASPYTESVAGTAQEAAGEATGIAAKTTTDVVDTDATPEGRKGSSPSGAGGKKR